MTIFPCSKAEIDKGSSTKQTLLAAMIGSQLKFPVGAETIRLWATGDGAKLYPDQNHARLLSVKWIRSAAEIQSAQIGLHRLFEGPHNIGTHPINNLFDFIRQLPADGVRHQFAGNPNDPNSATSWVSAVKSSGRLTDYNIAIGGSNVQAYGAFFVTKNVNGHVNVKGSVAYSLLDRFDWNKGVTFFKGLIKSDDLNLLEKCSSAAPFWSSGKWVQSVDGSGISLPNQPPRMRYTWVDK